MYEGDPNFQLGQFQSITAIVILTASLAGGSLMKSYWRLSHGLSPASLSRTLTGGSLTDWSLTAFSLAGLSPTHSLVGLSKRSCGYERFVCRMLC